jgi:hypothetical protein
MKLPAILRCGKMARDRAMPQGMPGEVVAGLSTDNYKLPRALHRLRVGAKMFAQVRGEPMGR